MKLEVWITVRDEKGTVIKRKKAESFVQGFIGLLNVQMSQASRTIKDTGGIDRSVSTNTANLQVTAASGDNTVGIQVGTGTTPVSVTDFKLVSPIAHGTGTGQLQYGATTVDSWLVSGSKALFNVTRILTNNSGGAITVREVGLIGFGVYLYPYKFLFERTLMEFTIPNGSSATVNYEISVSV